MAWIVPSVVKLMPSGMTFCAVGGACATTVAASMSIVATRESKRILLTPNVTVVRGTTSRQATSCYMLHPPRHTEFNGCTVNIRSDSEILYVQQAIRIDEACDGKECPRSEMLSYG